ncbi:hypothetical protein, partial [Nocardia sp. NPDC056000]|uniref:hypothetical protein n=1 Tax=Nocardia sp. NPDC056000 TaxID=3345674 RepID=UPI0035DC5851
ICEAAADLRIRGRFRMRDVSYRVFRPPHRPRHPDLTCRIGVEIGQLVLVAWRADKVTFIVIGVVSLISVLRSGLRISYGAVTSVNPECTGLSSGDDTMIGNRDGEVIPGRRELEQ